MGRVETLGARLEEALEVEVELALAAALEAAALAVPVEEGMGLASGRLALLLALAPALALREALGVGVGRGTKGRLTGASVRAEPGRERAPVTARASALRMQVGLEESGTPEALAQPSSCGCCRASASAAARSNPAS